ncbi:MAG: porin family protein [Microscillaceae bacterium]|nr:porin family protein [Microscillaceae bacterium]
MKKLIIVFLLFLSAQVSFAQDFPFFDLGLKAGANGSWIKNVTDGFDSDGMKFGFVGGVWARVKIPVIGLYVQPELVISQSGGKLSGFDEEFQLPFEQTVNLTNLDGVILVGQRFGLGPLALRINAGPVFSNVLSANVKTKVEGIAEVESDIKDDVKSPQIGLQAGIGLDISKINIDLRFQQNFSKLADDADDDENTKVSLLQLTVGFKIL